jgi:nifR3 family TIM-barrel protein
MSDNNTDVRSGFWKQIAEEFTQKGKIFFTVAPMADVTDTAFREMIAKYSRMGERGGGPQVMWTEFVSADGLASLGREVLKRDLEYTEMERPIVAQLFTSNPESMLQSARLCEELGFDGIDINMGCPDKSIEKQGAGSKMITTPRKAQEVIRSAREGAPSLPISVKTRIGFNKIEYKEWLPYLLDMNLPALTLHLRTRKELSLVPAHWEMAREIQEFVTQYCEEHALVKPLLIGNGDIKSIKEGREKALDTGFDGVMIGRGIFGTPWFFDEDVFEKGKSVREKLLISLEHVKLFEEKLGDIKSFAIMKKHYKAYCNGFDGAKELRVKLMEAKDSKEIETIIMDFLK